MVSTSLLLLTARQFKWEYPHFPRLFPLPASLILQKRVDIADIGCMQQPFLPSSFRPKRRRLTGWRNSAGTNQSSPCGRCAVESRLSILRATGYENKNNRKIRNHKPWPTRTRAFFCALQRRVQLLKKLVHGPRRRLAARPFADNRKCRSRAQLRQMRQCLRQHRRQIFRRHLLRLQHDHLLVDRIARRRDRRQLLRLDSLTDHHYLHWGQQQQLQRQAVSPGVQPEVLHDPRKILQRVFRLLAEILPPAQRFQPQQRRRSRGIPRRRWRVL